MFDVFTVEIKIRHEFKLPCNKVLQLYSLWLLYIDRFAYKPTFSFCQIAYIPISFGSNRSSSRSWLFTKRDGSLAAVAYQTTDQ